MHVDFSYWGFNLLECQEMAVGLKSNHTILGFHFMGNPMNINALGFLHEWQVDFAATHLNSRMNQNMTTGFASDRKIKLQSSSNCWICEGWSKVTFKLNPKQVNNPWKKSVAKTTAFLCLSIDNFEPDPMILDVDTGIYSLERMVPAIEIEYFFIVNGTEKYLMTKSK